MLKYTQDDWHVAVLDGKIYILGGNDVQIQNHIQYGTWTRGIATCGYEQNIEDRANARLISFAPKMFQMLQVLAGVFRPLDKTIENSIVSKYVNELCHLLSEIDGDDPDLWFKLTYEVEGSDEFPFDISPKEEGDDDAD